MAETSRFRMKMRIAVVFWAACVCFFLGLTALAVQRSGSGNGGALIFPYFTVLNGNNTLLTISTYSNLPKALKVHIRDQMGEAVVSLNVYLEAKGTWAGALAAEAGQTVLISNDGSCVLPQPGSVEFEGLGAVHSGFIEVIDMGTVSDQDLRTAVNTQDCAFLASQWADGVWSTDPETGLSMQSEGISGSASIINVSKGTQYGFPAVALQQFSSIVQHTSPDDDRPNLASAHDDGTEEGQTSSTLCDRLGCQTLQWEEPVEAVAHAIMARQLGTDFSTESSVNAQAEIVFTYPLRQYFEGRADGAYTPRWLFVEAFDREGQDVGREGEFCAPPPPPNVPNSVPYSDAVTTSVRVVVLGKSVEDFGEGFDSPILGANTMSFFPSEDFPNIPETGRINFYTALCAAVWPRPVGGGDHPGGWPVLATMLTEVSNGQLTNQEGNFIRANYGTADPLKTEVR